MSNLDSWDSVHLVNAYLNDVDLQKPERSIFEPLKEKLKEWRMLDIGIGLGRTTIHFAPLVKEYTGIDYSFGMIKTFKQLFPDAPREIIIKLGDARLMEDFETHYFDLVLFSFNGIDSLSGDDRLEALDEIKRVGKKGGLFVFSTHNLLYLDKLYSIKTGKSLRYFSYQLYRFFRLIYHNGFPGSYKGKKFAILNDGAHHFKLKTFYITPSAQIEQLEQLGFSNIRLFSLQTGEEIGKNEANAANKDSWIYYVCEF